MQEIIDTFNVPNHLETIGNVRYRSLYQVTNLAVHSFGSVGNTLASLMQAMGLIGNSPRAIVDQRLASLWFGVSIRPIDWEMPPIWDAIAGDYETKDGWIKLHTNLAHHRKAACKVLGCEASRKAVAAAVRERNGDGLEQAIVDAGGVAAVMRTEDEWAGHPHGKTVASEPLVHWCDVKHRKLREWQPKLARPLNGLRVLDLTRVLAGPVATRTLAAFGADVLRIDPPAWQEDNVVPDITLGKRCARLDLKTNEGKERFERLLSKADVLVHGYRNGALDGLGLDSEYRLKIAPNLIEVSLNAYGWEGPWKNRRGFDSLVQMSAGIASSGMIWAQADKPTPLPVQALDHATGYLMAASVIKALDNHMRGKPSSNAKLSLARTAELLKRFLQAEDCNYIDGTCDDDFSNKVEHNSWGNTRRLKAPLVIGDTRMRWNSPACALGSHEAQW
ncbi:CoA transferase [Kordiimonas sp. SCSIO 12610]|uniref:CoA transferase n=1 Tax=Kordiimonas sp. SCSIO 12610 TaxID=2829597 RepID=UPI00210BB5EF|nr:CoA transferase [Kordiimonas sp. SCSIO 12610]UTW56646.1 CoA transferase [Kordiimonas sp. SCSIO 12610]